MVSATTYSMIEFMKLAQVKLVYYCRDDPYWVISRYIFIYSLWKKDDWVWILRTIMYLCHIIKFSMCKGTKSFGHDKALACESRGFVVCSARALSNGCKSRVSLNSGNYIAKGKGVHREVKSERSRWQTSDLTYRNFIQGI